MANILDDLEKENQKSNIEQEFMMGVIDMITKTTGDKTAILLKISMQIDSKDRKIVGYFINSKTKNRSDDDTKIQKTISFYTQINQLYSDLEKELNI